MSPIHNDHRGSPRLVYLTALLAEAHRDDLLRDAARAHLAAEFPPAGRGRRRAIRVLALTRVTHARRQEKLSTPAGETNPAAHTEHDAPVEPRAHIGSA